MCGRFVLMEDETGIYPRFFSWPEKTRSEWDELIAAGRVLPIKPSYNIAPTQRVPVVLVEDGERKIELARWSFVPPWWKEEKPPKFATFNARDDKLKSSGFWKGALNSNRCLIPANGFYEWERKGKERLPHYIHRKDGYLMGFAGLYSHWTHPGTGEREATVTIITTATNELMRGLHDRIPLTFGTVEDELWSVWMDPRTKFQDVEPHVASREWPEMTMHRVTTDVNPTGKGSYVNEPYLIRPV